MSIVSVNGFGFDPDAFTARFANACAARGITSRAQFLTTWQAATAAQQIMFMAQMVFGSVRFPEDPLTLTSQQLAALGTP
jgi:hypothetical protein